MAIYIKEIYLPEDPNEMIEFAVKGNGNVFVIGEHFALEACNVQEPHGRLIDADEIFNNLERTGWYDNADRDIAEDLVLDAPTIIEAEEVE